MDELILIKFTQQIYAHYDYAHASLIPVQIWCVRLDVHRKPSSSVKVASVARAYDRRLVTSYCATPGMLIRN